MTEQLKFGEITRAEAERRAGLAHEDNPCIGLFGRDPMGRTCKYCMHLYAWQHSKRYYKCKFRKETNGAGSDHRVNWPACGKYECRA